MLFVTTAVVSQDYGYTTANYKTSASVKTASIAALTTTILTNSTRANTKLINHKNTTRVVYRIDGNVFTQKELFKHFRKAARTSNDVRAFTAYFIAIDAELSTILDAREITMLYNRIRDTRLSSRLDRLPSVL